MPAKTRKAATASTSSGKKKSTRGRGRPRKTAKENLPATPNPNFEVDLIFVREKISVHDSPLPSTKMEQPTSIPTVQSSPLKEGESNPNQMPSAASPSFKVVDPETNPKSATKSLSSSVQKPKTTSARKRQSKPKKIPPPNHLITEYFQVTTRKRKTSKDLKEEEDRNIIYHLENDIDPISMLAIHEFEGKGRGIIAINEIPKGSFICEYRGDLIQICDAKQREEEYERQNKGCYMYYFNWNNRQWCIDSTEDTGRFGRLINHSRKSPNCKSRLFIWKDEPHLIFIALFDIAPGTELLYDYGDTRRVALESYPWLKDS